MTLYFNYQEAYEETEMVKEAFHLKSVVEEYGKSIKMEQIQIQEGTALIRYM
jgi:hypothetical protein